MRRRSIIAGGLAAAWLSRAAWALPEPANPAIRRRYLDGPDGQIHVREAGPAHAAQPPLLLLHQTPLSGRMFDAWMPMLAARRQVIAVDTPGYGESDRPAARPDAAGYAYAILQAVTAAYGAPVDMLGYHTGAGLAAIAAARWPDHVRRLVFIAMPYFDAAQRADFRASMAQGGDRFAEDGSHLLRHWQGSWRARAEGQSVDAVARLVAEKLRPGDYREWALLSLMAQDLAPVLDTITQPALLIAPQDGLQEETAAAAARIARSQLLDMPDLRYGLFDVAGDRLAAAVLPFLDRG